MNLHTISWVIRWKLFLIQALVVRSRLFKVRRLSQFQWRWIEHFRGRNNFLIETNLKWFGRKNICFFCLIITKMHITIMLRREHLKLVHIMTILTGDIKVSCCSWENLVSCLFVCREALICISALFKLLFNQCLWR